MGVFKRRNKDGEEGETWYADYRDPSGRRIIKAVGPSKREAEAYLGKIKASIREGRFFDIKKESVTTFGELLDSYVEKIRDRKSYQETVKYYVPVIRTFFGHKLLSEIDYKLIENFRDQRKKTKTKHGKERSERSVDCELEFLRTILNKGVKWDMLDKNPFDKADDLLYNPICRRERALTEDEVRRLIEASPPHLTPILITAIYTGLRKNDLLHLEWPNVDLDRGLIHLVERKTGNTRVIVLNKDMISLLRSLPVKCGYVFPNKDGKPYTDLVKGYEKALKKAGIEIGTGRNKVVWHTMRHTCVSLLTERGADTTMVKNYVEHASEEMTERYTHLSEEYSRRTADLLNGLCGNKLEAFWEKTGVSA